MPFTQDDKKILVHALVGFRKASDQPDRGNLGFKVISCALEVFAIIHLIDIMMGKINPHLAI